MMGFSRSLYEEVRKDGIRISVVCLAAVNTRFIDVAGLEGLLPYSRSEMLQPQDVAETTVYHIAALPEHIVIEDLVVRAVCQPT